MNRDEFKNIISNRVLILDGAMGTELQKRGMPTGVCPEHWVMENPDTLKAIQKGYIESGSDIIYSCTFGANRTKLDEFGLGDNVIDFNKRLVQLSREVIPDECFVAGDIGPTGRFIKPLGDMDFEECIEIYKEQIQGLLEGGVDLFAIETMQDIQEARAALIAVKESCDFPVIVSMSFDNSQRTLTGTDPITALITLQSLGADAVGCNCSTGPRNMIKIISSMKPYARVPLIVKPNAGLPKLVDGTTVFDMSAEQFGIYGKELVESGANIIGGCCGTSREYIDILHDICKDLKPIPIDSKGYSAITSASKTVFLGLDNKVTIVGEKINPTGKKELQEAFRSGNGYKIKELALEQIEKGAQILDVNVGMSGIDEKQVMVDTVSLLGECCDVPLCLDSSSPEVIQEALRIYPGRALINSISQEKVKIEKLLPIAAKYGAMFILLPLNDEGVPHKAIQRQAIIEKVFKDASAYGYRKTDIIVDGLVMTVSSNQEAATETLKLIEWCNDEFGCATIIGLSNISFGLPQRTYINAAFLAMAIAKGLNMAIANPSNDLVMAIKMACDVLTKKDTDSMDYISCFSESNKALSGVAYKESDNHDIGEKIYNAILKGDKRGITGLIDRAISEAINPRDIVNKFLIPAIGEVGKLYEEKKYFLPQLIQGAETMKTAFAIVEPLLGKIEKVDTDEMKTSTIVLATVKGDIHDIGKNIVALMLRNFGFKVHDLGKDVSAKTIISEAKRLNAHIIGLSALMTTTMREMKTVIELAKKEGLNSKIMIGGAVVNAQYAEEIGADGYSKDAYDAVKLATHLTQKT